MPRPAAPADSRLFEYDGHWIAGIPGSDQLYEHWYEPRGRRTRRRSLKTSDLQTAKDTLVARRLAARDLKDARPRDAMLVVILHQYLTQHARKIRSAAQAEIAKELILDHWGNTATVADLTEARQWGFVEACSARGHSPSYISRTLSVLSAAIGHARLEFSPRILLDARAIAAHLDVPDPAPREWIPTLPQLGRILDAITAEHVFRYVIMVLNTAARPEAITDFTRFQMVEADRLLNLNPPGRRQTKKIRPTIRATDCLWGWLLHWIAADDAAAKEKAKKRKKRGKALTVPTHIVHYHGRQIASTKKTFQRLAHDLEMPGLCRYALRHFVATEVRRRGVRKDDLDVLLGHVDPRHKTTERYTKFSPDYLDGVVRAIDAMMADLQAHTTRPLFAPTAEPGRAPLAIVRAHD